MSFLSGIDRWWRDTIGVREQAPAYQSAFTDSDVEEYRGALADQQGGFSEANQQLGQMQQEGQAAFAHRDAQAEQIANAYRNAGFTNLADQYRQSFKQNAFNMARRGLGGGSADVDTQVRNREQTAGQARNIEQQASNLFTDQQMQAGQQQFDLSQMMYQNPFEQGIENSRIGSISAQTRRLMGIHDAATDLRQAQLGGAAQQAQALQQGIAGMGQSIGTGFAMQGGRMQ